MFKLATQGRKSILNHIRDHSNGEPHYAASADQDEFGYDYYNSPNITSTGNVLPTSVLATIIGISFISFILVLLNYI